MSKSSPALAIFRELLACSLGWLVPLLAFGYWWEQPHEVFTFLPNGPRCESRGPCGVSLPKLCKIDGYSNRDIKRERRRTPRGQVDGTLRPFLLRLKKSAECTTKSGPQKALGSFDQAAW